MQNNELGKASSEMQKVTAALPAQGLKEQSGHAASLQLALGLSRRILSLRCYKQNIDIKPIISWVLLSIFLYAFGEKKERKKIQLLKLYHFLQLKSFT